MLIFLVCFCACAVPVLVSVIRKSISTESSLTLHWSVPAQPHYTILQYQLRYCEKVRDTTRTQPSLSSLTFKYSRFTSGFDRSICPHKLTPRLLLTSSVFLTCLCSPPLHIPPSVFQERRGEEQLCRYRESDSNQVVLSDLRRATQYEVQVRARTMAGYGSFSPAASFRTLPDGKERPRLHSFREACLYQALQTYLGVCLLILLIQKTRVCFYIVIGCDSV